MVIQSILVVLCSQSAQPVDVNFGRTSSISLGDTANDRIVNSAIASGVFEWDYKWGQRSLGLGLKNSRSSDDFWFSYTIDGTFSVPPANAQGGGYQTDSVGSFKAKLVYDLDFKRSVPAFGVFEPNVETRIEATAKSNWKRIYNLSFDVEFALQNGVYSGFFEKNLPKVHILGIGSVQFKVHNLRLVRRY